MEYGSGGGGSGSGDHHDEASGSQRRKKRYHRHTTHQIQRLEGMYKECPHPDEKQRMQLSRELGLAPRQIKFWFQNRRTQMKAQNERADNCALRGENDKIRCENIAIREALKNVICPSCGVPPLNEDSYFDEHKLRMENAQLKEELDRVSSIAAKYIGRPISQLPPVQPIHISSLDLSIASFGGHGMAGPSLDLDLLPGSAASSMPNLPYQPNGFSDMDKSLMTDIAANAMEELLGLLRTNEPLWMKSSTDGRDVLNLETYERIFPRANSHLKTPNVRIEASRDSGVVIMNGLALVDMFMDPNKFGELFPTIVSMARTIEVISSGMLGSHSGPLQLMYNELQVLSPLVPTREFYFLRYCQQIEQGLWIIVDVSYDFPQDNQFTNQCRSRRLPSGCLIQDMPNGYSKVTWVEHVEIEDKVPTHRIYRDLIHSGLAFGAERWLAALQRMCERFACLMVSGTSTRDLEGVIPSPEGKRSMMKLAQRMVNNFCASISASNGHRWTTLSGTNEIGVRVTIHKITDPGQPNGVVLSAATTIWLPLSPQNVFNFFKDERTRPQWDVLSNGNAVQDVAHIANGSHPGNCISVLRAFNTSQNNMLILQQSCIDSSGSLVVYSPVDLPSINIAMSGEDPSYIPLLPSGFSISPDGQADQGDCASSSSCNATGSGSLITVAFQILKLSEVFNVGQIICVS
ncbi:homeobox-leucine zipper protein HDG11-like isoform X2 [Malus sylvestris]|uniref:homeobox-leucine zipper protein HDG11-like isoform X2 n=1 Tax=Malus sylvestris TaxID=3752 RepID=UPI0007ECD3C2|nr:homeobox-leucine zipper protein HDG11-like isoform X2 [Malus domestica]XP_050150015.1 homeobox-leucine zipper protein HDG11-like isoform X2 [Malus sylvestris]